MTREYELEYDGVRAKSSWIVVVGLSTAAFLLGLGVAFVLFVVFDGRLLQAGKEQSEVPAATESPAEGPEALASVAEKDETGGDAGTVPSVTEAESRQPLIEEETEAGSREKVEEPAKKEEEASGPEVAEREARKPKGEKKATAIGAGSYGEQWEWVLVACREGTAGTDSNGVRPAPDSIVVSVIDPLRCSGRVVDEERERRRLLQLVRDDTLCERVAPPGIVRRAAFGVKDAEWRLGQLDSLSESSYSVYFAEDSRAGNDGDSTAWRGELYAPVGAFQRPIVLGPRSKWRDSKSVGVWTPRFAWPKDESQFAERLFSLGLRALKRIGVHEVNQVAGKRANVALIAPCMPQDSVGSRTVLLVLVGNKGSDNDATVVRALDCLKQLEGADCTVYVLNNVDAGLSERKDKAMEWVQRFLQGAAGLPEGHDFGGPILGTLDKGDGNALVMCSWRAPKRGKSEKGMFCVRTLSEI